MVTALTDDRYNTQPGENSLFDRKRESGGDRSDSEYRKPPDWFDSPEVPLGRFGDLETALKELRTRRRRYFHKSAKDGKPVKGGKY